MIGYSLLPIYDPIIPLESFMSNLQAARFRAAVKAVTEEDWASYATCMSNCTTGFCVARDGGGYRCESPGTLVTELPAPMSAEARARIMPSRNPISEASQDVIPSLTLLQVSRCRMWQIVVAGTLGVLAALPWSGGGTPRSTPPDCGADLLPVVCCVSVRVQQLPGSDPLGAGGQVQPEQDLRTPQRPSEPVHGASIKACPSTIGTESRPLEYSHRYV